MTTETKIWFREAVAQEREEQDRKWGIQHHTREYWVTILGEEFGEVAKAVLECKNSGILTRELVHVAAVCMAWYEDSMESEK